MRLKALFFGSIGTICETSSMQRHAFNTAFKEAGVNWRWDAAEYAELLCRPGGAKRIAEYAEARGETVDADALHARKTEIFQEMLRHAPISLRPGVADTMIAARVLKIEMALVSTTAAGTIEAMLDQTRPRVVMQDFRFIGHGDMVSRVKPAPDIYNKALKSLDLLPDEVLAIEDTPESAQSAIAAGIPCIAFPGKAHRGREFPGTTARLETLSPHNIGLDAMLSIPGGTAA